jgi:hypothetical protein
VTASKDMHVHIATDFAICAFEAIHHAVLENGVGSCETSILNLEYYKGHELDNYIQGKVTFHKVMNEEKEKSGYLPDCERSLKLYNGAMLSVEFGRDSKFLIPDAERTCDNCGTRSKTKLLTCSRW